MITRHTLDVASGRIEIVECYPTLDDCLRDMELLAWEDPGNHWLDYVTDDESGEVAATAIYGPSLELIVSLADGRRLVFERPEQYGE